MRGTKFCKLDLVPFTLIFSLNVAGIILRGRSFHILLNRGIVVTIDLVTILKLVLCVAMKCLVLVGSLIDYGWVYE
jgi:hypothetical protein